MSKILKIVDRLNYYQVILLLFVSFSLTIVILVTTLTRSQIDVKSGSAYFDTQFTTKESITPQLPPEIFGVKPYLGKPGDEVVVWGKNFGINPGNGFVKIGNVECKIVKWLDNEIRFETPTSVSELISIYNGMGNTTYEMPFTVYNTNEVTEIAFDYQNRRYSVKNAPPGSILKLWYNDGTKSEYNLTNGYNEVHLDTVVGINWIALLDGKNNTPLPFKQNPTELEFINW